MALRILNTSKKLRELMLALAILAIAVGIAFILIKTKPEAKKQVPKKRPPLVETTEIMQKDAPVIIQAQGTIEPAVILKLQSEVSGQIIFRSPNLKKGSIINKGEVLIRIDPTDYEVALAQKQSQLARAHLDLAIEEAQSEVAKKEFVRRSNYKNLEPQAAKLAQRVPYLIKAQSDLKAAQAEVKRAHRTLAKTIIKAPINAIIRTSDLDLGEQVFTQGVIAELVGVDEFWAELSLPIDELRYISTPKKNSPRGSPVIISQISKSGTDIKRHGYVTKILPNLGPLGHMARILVSIPDPIKQNKNSNLAQLPLLPGALVSAQITGPMLKNIFIIPQEAIHQESTIYRVAKNLKLEKQEIKIIRKEQNHVYALSNLNSRDILVTTKSSVIKHDSEIRIDLKQFGANHGH